MAVENYSKGFGEGLGKGLAEKKIGSGMEETTDDDTIIKT